MVEVFECREDIQVDKNKIKYPEECFVRYIDYKKVVELIKPIEVKLQFAEGVGLDHYLRRPTGVVSSTDCGDPNVDLLSEILVMDLK